MKRSNVALNDVVAWDNLQLAFYRAARGKRARPAVAVYAKDLHRLLLELQRSVLNECWQPSNMHSFWIRDPKKRLIHAPSFCDRVLHHAIMACAGPVLDRALVDDTYACRQGRGTLRAVKRCQQHGRQFPWYVKVDMASYFASIGHQRLIDLLEMRFSNRAFLRLLKKIISSHQPTSGQGLPIGALTSQHFANYYLAAFDRYLLETLQVRGMVRYMDDVVWWCQSREEARYSLSKSSQWLIDERGLRIKSHGQINRSRVGITFCGYRVMPARLKLTHRKKQRFIQSHLQWESAWKAGTATDLDLQSATNAAVAAVQHADALDWRRKILKTRLAGGVVADHCQGDYTGCFV